MLCSVTKSYKFFCQLVPLELVAVQVEEYARGGQHVSGFLVGDVVPAPVFVHHVPVLGLRPLVEFLLI